ncbi:MAG: response regulator [Bdellovibrionales bacterium]|nr:response regulator [Bdellovibrionales bacterium]
MKLDNRTSKPSDYNGPQRSVVHRLSPLIVLAAALTVTGLAYQNAIRSERKLINDFLAREEARISSYFERESTEKVNALKRLARGWELVKSEQDRRWKELASQLVRHFPNIFQAIEYVGTDFKIQRIEPMDGNESVLGLDIRGRPFSEEELRAIVTTNAPRYTNPFNLKQGPRGLILYVPVYEDGNFNGLLISVFDIEKYVSDILHTLEHDFSFELFHENNVEYKSASLKVEPRSSYQIPIVFRAFGERWKLLVHPRPALIESLQSEIVSAIPPIGIFVSILISSLLWLFLREERSRRQLEVERRRADEASRAKGRFLATMSHEIRTPLNGILVAANLLSKQSTNSEDQELVDVIKGSGESLMALVNDSLDFAKIEAKRMEIEHVAFDLHKLVRRTVKGHALRHKQRPIEFECIIDPSTPRWIRSDSHRLTQILNNLLSNSAKFTENGRISVEVSRNASNGHETMLSFKVKDTGIGIEAEKLDHIFEDFSQADSSMSRRFGGTGLGLAICKHLSILMGGGISVDSVTGKGSTFTFTIKAEEALATEVKSDNSDGINGDLVRPLQILVAEDNLVNQKLIRKILEKLGHQCLIAENGIQAVEEYQKQAVDLILMDMQMPQLDGLDATRQIRALEVQFGSRTPIIALSANTQAEDREKCLDAGMDEFLTKPIAIGDLVKTIKKLQQATAD